MKIKTIYQLVIFSILIFLMLYIFNIYSKLSTSKNILSIKTNDNEIILKNQKQNIIKNIEYNSSNYDGTKYSLNADYGEIFNHNSDLIFMTDVNGVIEFKNNEKITVSSSFANFNSKTFETTFIQKVKIVRNDEIITSEKLYLVLNASDEDLKKNIKKDQNIIRITEDVKIYKSGYNLKADVIEIDLMHNKSKIYMYNYLDKVIVNSFGKN